MKTLFLTAIIAMATLSSCQKCIEDPIVGEPCADIYDPVCGDDGKTYGNECEAKRAGVRSWVKGPCDK